MTMQKIKFLTCLAATASALTACATSSLPAPPPPVPTPPPPPPPSPGLSDIRLTTTSNNNQVVPVDGYVIARAYATAGEDVRPAVGEPPNGIILLTRDTSVAPLNAAICDAFVNNLPSEEAVLSATPQARTISTFWLLSQTTTMFTTCTTLLQKYDYARSLQLRAQYGLSAHHAPALVLLQADGRYIAIDFTGQTPDQIRAIMIDWFGLVVRGRHQTLAPPVIPDVNIVIPPAPPPGPTPPTGGQDLQDVVICSAAPGPFRAFFALIVDEC